MRARSSSAVSYPRLLRRRLTSHPILFGTHVCSSQSGHSLLRFHESPKADMHDEVLHFWGKKGVEVFVFHLHLTRSTSGLVLEEEVITNPSLPASLDMDEQTKQFLPQSSSTLEILCWNTTSVNHRGKSRPSWFYRLFFQNRYCVALQKIRSEAAGVPSFSRTCFLLENFT